MYRQTLSIIQVVLRDMGAVNSAQADLRSSDMWQTRLIVNYLPPDVLLGWTIFGSDFDIWTLGRMVGTLNAGPLCYMLP